MSSQARKPYLGLKQSMIDFFSQPTRYIKASNMKESVFEKPYWDGEYPSMHYDPTVPDWPTWKDDPKKRKYPRKDGGGVPVANCPGCALYADPSSDCVTDPVEIHSGIFCTSTPGTATEKILTAKQKEYTLDTSTWGMTSATKGVPYGVSAGDCVLEVYAEVGAIKEVTIGAWAFIGPSAAVFVDPLISEHRICGRMVDGAGSVCIACVDVSCCGCDAPPSALALAADSTIDPGGTAVATASGGCGPYSFGVSGTGYTIVGGEFTAIITSASGTCGTNYSAYATVTVTDICGTVATKKIRSTGGTWSANNAGVAVSTTGCSSCVGGGCSLGSYVDDQGDTKYSYAMASNCVYNCPGGIPAWTFYIGSAPPVFCGDYAGCLAAAIAAGAPSSCSCSGNGGACLLNSAGRYVWVCA